MTADSSRINAITAHYGREQTVSEWFTVDQRLIDQFGQATCDSDWLHTDPVRAAHESPFGGTIAYGFWTVSMMTYFARQMMGSDYPEGALFGLNYGLDRLRFISPVPVGSRIRSRAALLEVEERENGRYLVRVEFQINVEGVEKPAMVAEWLTMLVFPT